MPPRAWVSSSSHDALIRLLVEERKRAGLTQRDLAQRIGRPPNFVARIETGQRNISVVEFVVLARALGADPLAMFGTLVAAVGDSAAI